MLSICNLTYFLNYFYKNICKVGKKHYLCTHKISRSGAVVARWAHIRRGGRFVRVVLLILILIVIIYRGVEQW